MRATQVQDRRRYKEASNDGDRRAHLRQGPHRARDLLGAEATELGLHPRGSRLWLRRQVEEERDGPREFQPHQPEGERPDR